MVDDKIALVPVLKLSVAAPVPVAQGLRRAVKAIRAKLSFRELAVFSGLMLAYYLSSKSYQSFVTPYLDLWPSDFKLIAVLLIMSPAFLLAARAVSGDRPGRVSRRAGLWTLAGANTVFLAAVSVPSYGHFPPHAIGELRAIGWASVWLIAPFVIVEAPRTMARLRTPRAAILATAATVEHLRRGSRTAGHLSDAFNAGNVYGLGASDAFGDIAVKGSLDDLIVFGRERGFNKIVVATLKSEGDMVASTAEQLVPLAADIYAYAVDDEAETPDQILKLVARRPIRSGGLILKSLEDFLLGAALTLAFAPLMGLIALAIWIDSPGPIFFRQKRHGYRHREIEVFKFRTMRVEKLDFACAQQTRRGDPRITRVGRFLRKSSLDELPQLLNVVRGEMALVGPRPHAVNMRTAEKLSHEIVPTYAHRHCVKPGITGWAQINGYRGALDAEEQLVKRVDYDMDYIRRWSVGLDLAILFKTVFHVVDTKNAF
jgi:exopolysaccharide biosynthesis polyprenyl glycosylphosphotransferase